MLYKQRFGTFIRTYDDIGYIVNKCNFTDQVFDRVGAVFLKTISRKEKSIDVIVEEIHKTFPQTDKIEIKQDAEEFLSDLEEDGFIVSGNSAYELESKDNEFSYTIILNNAQDKEKINYLRTQTKSQIFLDDYFKKKPQLISFQIEITSKCNERCVHCYIPHENKNCDISPELFYDILKQCKAMGVMDITLSGGEPMLHRDFLSFLHVAKSNDFSVTILSNLTLLTDEIISELKNLCLSGVQVSLYSIDEEIHDSITKVKGSCKKTKASIQKLIDNNIPVQISCPTMKQNLDSYSDVAKWAADHGLRVFTDCILMARYDHSKDNLDNRMSLNSTQRILNDIIENDTSYQELIMNTDFDNLEHQSTSEDIICGVGLMSLCMSSSGKVFPCAGWQSYVCGDVNQQSIKDIWENSPQLNYLRSLRKKDLKTCIDCDYQQFCSVCMARNANENPDGDPLRVNKTLCEVAKLNKQIAMEWKKNH